MDRKNEGLKGLSGSRGKTKEKRWVHIGSRRFIRLLGNVDFPFHDLSGCPADRALDDINAIAIQPCLNLNIEDARRMANIEGSLQ